MPSRAPLLVLSLATILVAAPRERAAHACGAGAVTRAGSVGVDAQRIFLSVRGGKTEIVVQLIVPRSPSDYGALIPLPAQPTIDAPPVAAAELDALDRATQVEIPDPSDSGGRGCGCGSAADAAGPGGRGVLVETVEIGPVSAASLRADDSAAVNTWLADSGYVLPAGGRALVEAYAGPGRFFVAVKRSGAITDTADSLGLHLSLDGDHRGLPLRFTRLGAASRIAFTVFVVAAQAAGPSAPYTTFGVDALDPADAFASYADAVADAVAARGALGARLATLVEAGHILTRYSTVLDAAAISDDADFHGAAPANVARGASSLVVAQHVAGASGLFVLIAAVALARRRTQRGSLGVGGINCASAAGDRGSHRAAPRPIG